MYERLERLVDHGELSTKKAGASGRVWWQSADSTAPQSRDSEYDRQLDRVLEEAEDSQTLWIVPADVNF